MSAAVCWLRRCANVEPPSSARPANPSSVIRDSAKTTRTWPLAARSPRSRPAAVQASRLSLWSFDLCAAELVNVTAPISPEQRRTGGERGAEVTRTQLPPLHGPVTVAPAMSMHAYAGSRAPVPARAGRRGSRSPRLLVPSVPPGWTLATRASSRAAWETPLNWYTARPRSIVPITSGRKTVIAIENSTRPCPRSRAPDGDLPRQLVTMIDRTWSPIRRCWTPPA